MGVCPLSLTFLITRHSSLTSGTQVAPPLPETGRPDSRTPDDPERRAVKILFVTQYYPPELGAAQERLSAYAEYLAEAGHEVTVLTAHPSYQMKRRPAVPCEAVEWRNGGQVCRVPTIPSFNPGFAPPPAG